MLTKLCSSESSPSSYYFASDHSGCCPCVGECLIAKNMGFTYQHLHGTKDEAGAWQFSGELTGKALEGKFPSSARSSSVFSQLAYDAAKEFSNNSRARSMDADEYEFECLFFLARRMMGNLLPKYQRAAGIENQLAPYALVYFEGLVLSGTCPLLGDGERIDWNDSEQVMESFEATYLDVRYAEGESLLGAMLSKAKAEPLRLKMERTSSTLFLSLAYHLQVRQGNANICLPVVRLAELMEVKPPFISQLRKKGIHLGYLEEQGKHNQKAGRATPFRFKLDQLTASELPKKPRSTKRA